MSQPHATTECHEHHDLVCDFGGPRPKIVVLCGSTRFVKYFNEWSKRLTEDGAIVLTVEVVTTQDRSEDPQHSNPELKARLDELHKRKIDLADDVFVLNVDGYIGESTRSEIEYAERIGRPVFYLEPNESCVTCGKQVLTMAFRKTGYCCDLCRKVGIGEITYDEMAAHISQIRGEEGNRAIRSVPVVPERDGGPPS